MRPRPFVAVVVAMAMLASSCGTIGKFREAQEKLLDAIHATQSQPREFLYKETTDEGSVAVKGVFEDDLRYSFVLARDGVGAFEAVVSDDTLAVRALDPALIPPDVELPDPSLQAVLDGLRSGEWVVDPGGAPPLDFVFAADVSGEDIGRNPIRDALGIFAYLDLSVGEARRVQEWNKEAVAPAYRGEEGDYFDDPQESLGVKRFDLVRPELPRREGTQARDSEPQFYHFRKMAFYVRSGRVIKVKEDIDFEHHFQMRRAKAEGKPVFLLKMLERLEKKETEVKIRPRKMTLQITRMSSASVVIPAGLSAELSMFVPFIFGEGVGGAPGEPTEGETPASGSTGEGGETPAPGASG